MYYSDIHLCDIANGTGCRTSLFVSGCTHHCKGCFNQTTWTFTYGTLFTEETEDSLIESSRPDYIAGLSILGGEPMEINNQSALLPFIRKLKRALPNKTIWVYSGYTYEELTDITNIQCHTPDTQQILELIDVLVDGEFVLEQKDITLKFRGSSNQRLIDVPATLQSNEVTLLKL